MGRFRSKAQWAWAFATRQPFARRWAKRSSFRSLPRRARGGRRRR